MGRKKATPLTFEKVAKVETDLINSVGMQLHPVQPNSEFNGFGTKLLASPYTKFIPMFYLDRYLSKDSGIIHTLKIVNDYHDHNFDYLFDKKRANEKRTKKIAKLWLENKSIPLAKIVLGSPVNTLLVGANRVQTPGDIELNKTSAKNIINLYLMNDVPMDIADNNDGTLINSSSLDRMAGNFFRMENKTSFTMRSYRGYTGMFTMIAKAGSSIHAPYKPYILPVILPENLIYQKLHILATGKIDLTKVVLLVDGQLEMTDFPLKSLKALYKSIKPTLETYGFDIWKVPSDFIIDNCFLGKFTVPGKTIMQKKKEISTLVENFINNSKPEGVVIDQFGDPVTQDSLNVYNHTEILKKFLAPQPIHTAVAVDNEEEDIELIDDGYGEEDEDPIEDDGD